MKHNNNRFHYCIAMVILSGLLACAQTPPQVSPAVSGKLPDTSYIFSYFAGERSGMKLAWSPDGYHWSAVNNGEPLLVPKVGANPPLIRDPSLALGPDGMFHMVWTTSWGSRNIGYTSSRDLVNWSEQKVLPVMEHEPQAGNCWAPEIYYDSRSKTWYIFWSTTISGKFEPEGGGHRCYFITTRDFQTFTPTRLLMDPGFNCIDETMFRFNGRYGMIFKDEREGRKDLRLAWSDKPEGPWTPEKDPFSMKGVEGPTWLKLGDDWIIYCDGFAAGGYKAYRTRDFKSFTEITREMVFPPGITHGTALPVPGKVLARVMWPVCEEQADFFVEGCMVRFRTALEGTRIRYTLDGSQPTAASTLYSGPVKIDHDCTIRAVTVFSDGRLSVPLTTRFHKKEPLAPPPRPERLLVPGLRAQYFEVPEDQIQTVPDVSRRESLKEAVVPSPAGQHLRFDKKAGTAIVVRMEGFMEVPKSGAYTFWLSAVHGASVRLNHQPVFVDTMFNTPSRAVSLPLGAGLYPIEITYVDQLGGRTLNLEWAGPDTSRHLVEPALFKH